MKDKIEIVQLLRGLAALLVCCFHMKGILVFSGVGVGKILFGSGSIGVPFFFMISGFIMVFTTRNSTPTWAYVRSFFLKRAIRIIPVYYLLTLLLIIGVGQLGFYFERHPNLAIAGFLFSPSGLKHVGPSYGMPPLEVGWSLNYEMFFYLLLGLSIFGRKYRWHLLSVTILFLIFVLPLATKGTVMSSLAGSYRYSIPYLNLITNPIILFFLVGVLVGLTYLSNFRIKSIVGLNIAIVILLVGFALTYAGIYPTGKSYYYDLILFGLLFFALMMRNKERAFVIWRPFVSLGDISYSLYLVHPVVLLLNYELLKAVGFTKLVSYPAYFLLAMGMIIGLSALSYNLFEQRLSRWLTSKLIVGRPVVTKTNVAKEELILEDTQR